MFGTGNINVEYAKVNTRFKEERRRLAGGRRSLSMDYNSRSRSPRTRRMKSRRTSPAPKNPRIFIGSIPADVDEDQVRHKFGRYGKILECTVK